MARPARRVPTALMARLAQPARRATGETRGHKESPGRRGHKAFPVTKARKARKGPKGLEALQVPTGRTAIPVPRGPMVPSALQVQTEPRAHQGRKVNLALTGQPARPAPMAP